LRRERTLAAESSLLAEPNPGLLGDYPQEVMLKLSKPVIEAPWMYEQLFQIHVSVYLSPLEVICGRTTAGE
jgi:hypothetical protein